MPGRDLVLSQPRDVAVLVSPVRQEILAAIGLHGPVSAPALAAHLGRATTSLYHHLAQLVRVGVVAVERRRRDDGRSEQVYGAVVRRVTIGGGNRAAAVSGRQRASAAMMRLASRELVAAIGDEALRREGSERAIVGLRGKAWLGAAQLRELNGHLRAIEKLLHSCGDRRPGAHPYAVTLVLAPTDRARRRRSSS